MAHVSPKGSLRSVPENREGENAYVDAGYDKDVIRAERGCLNSVLMCASEERPSAD